MILNPYGTNTLGVNIYFNTNEALEISYTVSVDNEKIPEFSQVLKNDNEDNFTKEHKYQLIGLIPGEINNLNLVGKNKNGEKIESNFKIDMTSVECKANTFLEKCDGDSIEPLKDGLFVMFLQNSVNAVYDNNGILRAELIVNQDECQRIIFYKGDLYYSYDWNILGVIDRLGKIKDKYVLGAYIIHHDYIMDTEKEKLILLVTSYWEYETRVMDIIIIVDMKTGKLEKVIDMKELLPEIYEKAGGFFEEEKAFIGFGMDWIHLNSLCLVDDKDELIISSRETSSIICLKNIYNTPSIKYIISDKDVYKNTEYADLVLNKVGNFISQASQHSVEYVMDNTLENGQYYLIMMNNNLGENFTIKDFPWDKYPGTGTYSEGEKSMYYKYLVDENKSTYELIDKFYFEYSPINSNIQKMGENIIISAALAGCFGEFDKNNILIRKFNTDRYSGVAYRVFKYDFKDTWFK